MSLNIDTETIDNYMKNSNFEMQININVCYLMTV